MGFLHVFRDFMFYSGQKIQRGEGAVTSPLVPAKSGRGRQANTPPDSSCQPLLVSSDPVLLPILGADRTLGGTAHPVISEGLCVLLPQHTAGLWSLATTRGLAGWCPGESTLLTGPGLPVNWQLTSVQQASGASVPVHGWGCSLPCSEPLPSPERATGMPGGNQRPGVSPPAGEHMEARRGEAGTTSFPRMSSFPRPTWP